VSTTNEKNNNVKINFITKLKFKIVIIVKRKLGNPVLNLKRKNAHCHRKKQSFVEEL
jgi:hypothetical protein